MSTGHPAAQDLPPDSHGRSVRYLRLSVTDRCSLRCRYCMGVEGVPLKSHAAMLTEEETVQAVEAAASLGVNKVRITGGEPLVKRNILSICERTAAVPGIRELCMTTNGLRLPELAWDLRAAGVQRINLSLDTLDPKKYTYITRVGELDRALAGLEAALSAGFEKVKINAVLIGGFNVDEVGGLARLTLRRPVDVRFIELMPMPDIPAFGQEAFVSNEEVLRRIPELEALDAFDGVARLYRLPGALGNVGLISPISQCFCDRCDRLRLTADGKLKPCLHSAAEYDIKGLDRAGMRAQFEAAILAKPPCRPALSAAHISQSGRAMNQIGG